MGWSDDEMNSRRDLYSNGGRNLRTVGALCGWRVISVAARTISGVMMMVGGFILGIKFGGLFEHAPRSQ